MGLLVLILAPNSRAIITRYGSCGQRASGARIAPDPPHAAIALLTELYRHPS
jgi:hypothetical protein